MYKHAGEAPVREREHDVRVAEHALAVQPQREHRRLDARLDDDEQREQA